MALANAIFESFISVLQSFETVRVLLGALRWASILRQREGGMAA
jgi:hypothetical protein